MNYHQTTGKSIQSAFEEFHALNPDIYEVFIKMAFDAIRKGKKKISAKLICNVIRWEVFMRTDEPTLFYNKNNEPKRFKLNDAYTSRYARLFVRDYPRYKDYFEWRELRSEGLKSTAPMTP